MTVICKVPGCEREFETEAATGPHYAAHRRHGDKGVPPMAKASIAKAKRVKAKRNLPAVVSNGVGKRNGKPEVVKFTPRDVIDMGLMMMFPVAVPREDVYEVTQWVTLTEAVAGRALRV